MDLLPRSVGEGLEGRLTGPGKGRFVLQPLISIALGIRDGIVDARQGKPPFFIRVLFESESRLDVLKSGLKQIAVPLTVGVVLDAILQWVIFQTMFVLPALIAGTVLVGLPYSIARGLSNRIARRWYDRRAALNATSHTTAGV